MADVSYEDTIRINPEDAKKLGIKEGDKVRVTSVIGSFVTRKIYSLVLD